MGGFSIWHILLLLIILPLLFAPSIIAFRRDAVHKWWILAINVLLNWTGIGWIVALIWSLIGPSKAAAMSDREIFQ